MKKTCFKLTALVLSLVLLLSALPAQAAGQITQAGESTPPKAPSWVKPEEYVTFADPYHPTLLERMEKLRVLAESGASRPSGAGWLSSESYRLEDILLAMRFYQNDRNPDSLSCASLHNLIIRLDRKDPRLPVLLLWNIRYYTVVRLSNGNENLYPLQLLDGLYRFTDYTLDDVFSASVMDVVTKQQQAAFQAAWKEYIKTPAVILDGEDMASVRPSWLDISERQAGQAEVKNGKLMVSVELLAPALGMDIQWDTAKKSLTLDRAGTRVVLRPGSASAQVNGKATVLPAAPYRAKENTMIPYECLSTLWGQEVKWDKECNILFITENKAAAGKSNTEAWTLAMNAIYTQNDRNLPEVYGMRPRSYIAGLLSSRHFPAVARSALAEGWGVYDRTDLVATMLSLTESGYNDSFLVSAALVNSLSPAGYSKLLAQSQGMDQYMWPYTKELSKKWGDRGILCWDLFRVSMLAQLGYVAGYLTYQESLVLTQPAIEVLKANFSSWEEACGNYLDGYHWWSRTDLTQTSLEETPRGKAYLLVKEEHPQLFDDALFKTDLIPVPGLTIDDILATLK